MSTSAPIVGVVSGKGGVGKTNLVANLGIAAARRGARVLAVDGDVGLSNLDVLLGLRAERTAAHVLAGDCSWNEAIVTGPAGLHLLPGAAARPDLTALRPAELGRLLIPLLEAKHHYDLILLDVAAGIAPTVVSLALVCDRLLLLTTPEPTSLADAYATLKTLAFEQHDIRCEVVVNAVRDEREAREAHDRLQIVARRFLGIDARLLGHVVKDGRLADAVKLQQAVVQAFPAARCSRQLRRLADQLLETPKRSGHYDPVARPVEV
jgi:flagellar biosynthesis protein FlhG